MISPGSLNYGALYSFEPDFIRDLNRDEDTHQSSVPAAFLSKIPKGLVSSANRTETSDNLDTMDSMLSGFLMLLVMMLMIVLISSLATTANQETISRLSGSNAAHTTKH